MALIKTNFHYKNYQCCIVFQDGGWYCGYVLVPYHHSVYELDYNDIPIQCHGGLTYSEHYLLGVDYPGWWIGFDCAHSGDTIDKCNVDFCVKECKKIVDQLREME